MGIRLRPPAATARSRTGRSKTTLQARCRPAWGSFGDLRPCEWQAKFTQLPNRKKNQKSITSSGTDASAASPPDASLKQVGRIRC